MNNTKNLGIWMDHLNADFIPMNGEGKSNSIQAEITPEIKEEAIQKGERRLHNKEQQLQESFYKEIATEILKFDQVLLFGPTRAKRELLNYLHKDLHFKDIKIDIESADNMTENEKHAFVKNHFQL